MNIFLISALRQPGLNFVRHTYCCSQEANLSLAYLSLVRLHMEYAAAAWDPYMAKDIEQLERVQRCAAHFVKKDYRHTTSVTGLLNELGWLPLFKRRKHSHLTVFYKAFNNLSAISLDHLSASSWHTRASNEKKFMSLPVSTNVFKYSFVFSGHYRLEFPPIGCSSLALDSVLPRGSAELGILQPLLIIRTLRPAVTGGLHPLLDIAPRNRSVPSYYRNVTRISRHAI